MSHVKTNTIPAGWTAENGMHVITDLSDPVLAAFVKHDRLVIELFAAGGGMSEGIKYAGVPELSCLGIEWDASACMTATRAGHPRLHFDVALLDPTYFGRVWGFHASPPCQGFSPAGKGQSRGDTDLLLWAIKEMGANPTLVEIDRILDKVRAEAKSPLSSLSLEPLRWIIVLRPEWFTLEQVKTVLPLWEAYADVLRPLGYSVWTGIESSEKFGVPQTRSRALAMGSLVRDVSGGPAQTHSRYITSGKNRGVPQEGFAKYVTMKEALDWGMTQRPYLTLAPGTKSGGTDPGGLGGSGARRSLNAERDAGRWVDKAFMGDVRNSHGCVRPIDAPAPTITSSADNGNFQWVPEAANEGTTAEDMAWSATRPSPTIVSSFHPEVVAAPKWRKPGDGPRQKAKGSISISVTEAGILQSFPADYPWTGTLTKQWEQVGNAVPPLMGQALVETVLGHRAPANA